ncbi:MAG TPA: GSCFA domain-containing protein [Flavobacteriaceae bacterium]|nr:GSCFA domain-containing protein [Flavobacteriaceae bacterium]
MNFRTQIKLQPERNQIDYNSKLLFLGSCFSENIYKKFKYFKFKTVSNPFGIIYNPIAIEKIVSNAISKHVYTEANVFEFNERWHSFDAHSNLSASTKNETITNLNHAVKITSTQLKQASHIFITLGTAWVYQYLEDRKIVSNCHKLPSSKFKHNLLSVNEIVTNLQHLVSEIKKVNSSCSIIFTVSPVRHLKDGFTENAMSKAHLLTAIHNLISENNEIYYFPSYEIMMDDLRDYRFYNEDMLHPNNLAIDYIWEQLKSVWLNESTASIIKKVESVQKALAHKPFNPNSQAYTDFLAKIEAQKKLLKNKHNIIF